MERSDGDVSESTTQEAVPVFLLYAGPREGCPAARVERASEIIGVAVDAGGCPGRAWSASLAVVVE